MSEQPESKPHQQMSRRLFERAVKLLSIPMGVIGAESSSYSSSHADLIAWKTRIQPRQQQEQTE